jgi:hypothetical protein
MVAPNNFRMTPIANPFTEENWDIDQVFQMSVFEDDKENFAFGFYDNRQNNHVIQLGQGNAANYFTVPDATSLGQIIRHITPDGDSWRFTEVSWAGGAGAPLPAANEEADLLALRLNYIKDNGAASFDCHVRPRNHVEVVA